MKISSETVGRLLASGRGYAQFALGIGATLGVISSSQQKTLVESGTEVVNGIMQVAHGLTSIWQILVVVGAPVISVIVARWSSNSAKTVNQAAAVTAATGAIIVAPPDLAKATPDNPNIVSNADMKVIAK